MKHHHARIVAIVVVFQLFFLCMVPAVIQPRPGSDGGSKWASGGGARRGRGKHSHGVGPTPGFTGGSELDNNEVEWCTSEALPGCQACPDGSRCTACWVQYPNATGSRFVLNPFTGQCDCAPGYGLLPNIPPAPWTGRHLLEWAATAAVDTPTAAVAAGLEGLDANTSVLTTPAALMAINTTQQVVLQDVPPGLFLPDPLPSWASNCLPCPVNYYSPGGQQGFARCKPCPGTYTTAYATAASTCLYPYCGPGQEPSRRSGRCRPCPIGTYSSSPANNQPCYPCPAGFTTGAAGSRVFTDCRVPVCGKGQQLNLDLLVCFDCRGNTFSPGGQVSQGTAQPQCRECPFGTAADQARSTCLEGACPYPDNFAIICRTVNLLNQTDYYPCGPNGKPAKISQYCTAYPPGAELALYDSASKSGGIASAAINCPAGAYSSNTKWPVIVSYNGRRDCLCSATNGGANGPSCLFAEGPEARVKYPGGEASSTVLNPLLNVTIPDAQYTSLRTLVTAMVGLNRSDAYIALTDGYCRVQELTKSVLQLSQPASGGTPTMQPTNWVNPLQVNCTGPFITRVALQIASNESVYWIGNGALPKAYDLRGLSQLRMLTCVDCELGGTLPRDWGSQGLMELRVLDLPGNNLTGTLPETWGYMVNLEELTLSSSGSMGTIPAAWGYMRSLKFVNLTGVYLDNSTASCAPWQWRSINNLVVNETFWPPANYGGIPFCEVA